MATVYKFLDSHWFSAVPIPSPLNRATNEVSRSDGHPRRVFVRIAPYILNNVTDEGHVRPQSVDSWDGGLFMGLAKVKKLWKFGAFNIILEPPKPSKTQKFYEGVDAKHTVNFKRPYK